MAYSYIASDIAGDTNSPTTSAIDSTGGDLLVLAWAQDNANTTRATPSDSKSNTYVGMTQKNFSASAASMFYVASPTVGSGHTASYTQSGAYPTIALLAFSGAHATPLDQESTNSGSGTSLQPGSITPTEDNCLIVCILAHEGATSISIDSGFTIVESLPFLGPAEGLAVAYKIQTTAAAVNPTWSWSGSTNAGSCIASFKAAGGGGGATAHLLTLLGCGG